MKNTKTLRRRKPRCVKSTLINIRVLRGWSARLWNHQAPTTQSSATPRNLSLFLSWKLGNCAPQCGQQFLSVTGVMPWRSPRLNQRRPGPPSASASSLSKKRTASPVLSASVRTAARSRRDILLEGFEHHFQVPLHGFACLIRTFGTLLGCAR